MISCLPLFVHVRIGVEVKLRSLHVLMLEPAAAAGLLYP